MTTTSPAMVYIDVAWPTAANVLAALMALCQRVSDRPIRLRMRDVYSGYHQQTVRRYEAWEV